MRHIILGTCLLVSLSACDQQETKTDAKTESTAHTSATHDVHGDPVQLVEALFAAAKAGDNSHLKDFCDPKGESDGDVQTICKAASNPKDWDELKTYFGPAKVNGPARLKGDRAEVDILFGPAADAKETINLIQRDGKWYLLSL